MSEVCGYVYMTMNMLNNNYYIGQHKAKRFDKSYYGSGVAITNAIKKYGRNNFKVFIIKWCKNIDILNADEEKYVAMFLSEKACYNIGSGGNCTNRGIKMSGKNKELLRERMKLTRWSDETRERTINTLKKIRDTPEYSKEQSEKMKRIWADRKKDYNGVIDSDKWYIKKGCYVNGKMVRCKETNMIYKSAQEAICMTGCSRAIYNVLHGRAKTANGLHWEYVKQEGAI